MWRGRHRFESDTHHCRPNPRDCMQQGLSMFLCPAHIVFAPISCMPQWLPHSLPIGSERVRGNRRVDCIPRVLQNRAQGPLARIITFRTPPLVHPSLPRKPSRNVRVPTDGYHLSGCTWGNGPAGPRKVARRTRNIKHDRRGERQMPDPGRQHRGRRAFRPQPNNLRS